MNHQTSRFARVEEIEHPDFKRINNELIQLNKDFSLPDHTKMNGERFDWYKASVQPMYYASRLWEYPFAILASDFQQGIKVADIGCGTTPFTSYLVNKLGGENVWGIDQDVITTEINQLAFGLTKDYIDKVGFNFVKSDIDYIQIEDDFFDIVYCISVLEHIDDPIIQMNAIHELVRITKPGGQIIITMDMGINLPLTNVFDVIKHSGLFPIENISFKWPDKRFVSYGSQTVDVFGLILVKGKELIQNHNRTSEIPQYKAYDTYKQLDRHHRATYDEMLFIQEYRLNKIKSVIKLLLGRYHF